MDNSIFLQMILVLQHFSQALLQTLMRILKIQYIHIGLHFDK